MFITLFKSAIRFSTVFLFGSTGETITEKSGHLNLGTPGIMCAGAIGGCIGESLYISSLADVTQINGFAAVMIAVLFSVIFSGVLGLIYSFFTITLRCNQNITGLTITTFGVGLTNYLASVIDKTGFNYASNAFTATIPGVEKLGWFGEMFLSYGVLVYAAIIMAVITAVVMRKTRTGLSLRAVGENPATADATGINVTKYKYVATCTGCAISGLGGLFYIMDYLHGSWEYSIDALGWLALAIVIFSVWRPHWGILGSILFGTLYILPNYIGVSFSQRELINMVPYVVTILVLIATSIFNRKESQPPASLGLPYFREER